MSNKINNFEFVFYKQTGHRKMFSLIFFGGGVRALVTWRCGQGYRAYIWISCFSFSLIRFLGIRLILNYMCTLCFSQFVIPMLWQISGSNSKMLQFPHGCYKSGTVCWLIFWCGCQKKKKLNPIAFPTCYDYLLLASVHKAYTLSIVQISFFYFIDV